MRSPRRIAHAASLAVALAALPAHAGFVQRGQIVSDGDFLVDAGLGVGHVGQGAADVTGVGLNLGMRAGVAPGLEAGFRTGLRLGDDGKSTQADSYGRTFDTETYGVGRSALANPELSLRRALRAGRLGLALDARLYLPFEDGTNLGVMIGVPVALRLAAARLDTGLYLPVVFRDGANTLVSIPAHLWLDLAGAMYAGVLSGIRFPEGGDSLVPLGVALGVALDPGADLKTWLLLPAANKSTANLGVGVGVEFRL